MSLRRARSAGPASTLFRHLHAGEGGFSIAEELVSLIVLASAVGLVLAGIYLGSQGIRLRRGQVLAAVRPR